MILSLDRADKVIKAMPYPTLGYRGDSRLRPQVNIVLNVVFMSADFRGQDEPHAMTSLVRGARYKEGCQWIDKLQHNAQVFTPL